MKHRNLTTTLALLLTVLAAVPAARAAQGPMVAGYVETIHGGVGVDALDLGPLTHVIDAFMLPTSEGRLHGANGMPRLDLVERCHAEGRHILMSIGGGTVPGKVFTAIAERPTSLQRFATGAVATAMEAGYDGLDIDWEFPDPLERRLYVRLITAVREAMVAAEWKTHTGEPALLFYGVTTGYWLRGYDFAALSKLTDAAVYFGYDFRNPSLGPWMHYDMMWPKEAAEPIEASVSGVIAEIARRGYDPGKILVGLPFYTSANRPWSTARKTRGLAEAKLHPVFLEKNIDGEWITDAEAMEAKVRAALGPLAAAGRPVGGIAIWQIGHQGRHHELTNAISRVLDEETVATRHDRYRSLALEANR
jgi:hypothetical protein